ncbi:hypothetical protein WA026_002414 [Henosepilachna vigintioctopunctata]|uniref:Protein RIC1 homolog n=1 Tax=Henosepilachna vigintioctopunctata TaxID=420089 RepID=A0AAW1U0B8_9CUCU
MYFPTGWPKVVKLPDLGQYNLTHLTCNRDRVLFSILTGDSLGIWFCKPCVPIVYHRRTSKSLEKFGTNVMVEWKPDSSMIVIVTSEGHLLFYKLGVISDQKGLYVQTDSPQANLRRDSAELFIKEIIPPIFLELCNEVFVWNGKITGISCITMTEFMISTSEGYVLRYRWDGSQYRDYNLDLRRIPFCINQQVSKAIPIVEENTFIIDIDYSPLIGGFSIVLNDGRAAFLTASSLKFDPNQVQGIWAQGIEDATCTRVNHKYRLITFGRSNSECIVYYVDESTGGLEISHNCILSTKDYTGNPGEVNNILWTPDGCALVASWTKGGIAMWSTFGALLMCSLKWDYGLNVDVQKFNPLQVLSMEFAAGGYQLWFVLRDSLDNSKEDKNVAYPSSKLFQLDFVKSALTANPCMSHQSHLYLQGEDKLYVNSVDTLLKKFSERTTRDEGAFNEYESLAEGRQWLVIAVPSSYSGTNWPIRYSAIDSDGQNIAIAGRTGLAHYSLQTRRWKLFGNETQEKDFIVAGGLLWWRDYMIMGCYSIIENTDQLRFYPRDTKLDNKFAKIVTLQASVLLINVLQDQLITFGTDNQICIWVMKQCDSVGKVEVARVQLIDISSLTPHSACIASISLTSLRTELGRGQQHYSESMVLNVSGRLLLVQREISNGERYTCSMPTVLASCVENVWVPARMQQDKVHLTEALWLFCGSHGMRVWLPLYPRDKDKAHTFMSKRIMLPFHLKIYPLAILFEDAIILGVENDTLLYLSDSNSPFSLPFSVLERTSQVYLHQILRQLIRRNLGYHAWEIARSCMSLPYFPHSLELLLHEVLEEEATSKEPIPDAQLPSIIEFIMEFPVYLQTVVQCARKTEIALWPYLFSAAGKPKDLFQECMTKRELDTAASYLIILQNLETSSVSRQYATLLLNTALDHSKWEIAKDLVRFLRAIDSNDVESPRNSLVLPAKLGLPAQSPPVSPDAEDISLILGNVQVPRVRSYSTTVSPKLTTANVSNMNSIVETNSAARKKSVPNSGEMKHDVKAAGSNSAEEFFIDVILQKHARRLLSSQRLIDLGYFAAHLDFHLVTWLGKERERAARVDDFVAALKKLHDDFDWPYPNCTLISNEGGSANNSPTESGTSNMEEYLKALKLDVENYLDASSRVGDSGYISFQEQPHAGLTRQLSINETSSQAVDTEIGELDNINDQDNPGGHTIGTRNQIKTSLENKTRSLSLAKNDMFSTSLNLRQKTTEFPSNVVNSIASVTSSTWEDDADFSDSFSTENWEVPSTQILEHLSKSSGKGSHKSEIQLRYLLQLFMEANCLEWSLLISVLLRDAMAVLRTVNAAKSSDQSIESVTRLRQQFLLLHYWTNTECLAYRTFMLAIQNQISVLSKILSTKTQQQQIIEYQQALSATLKKASFPSISRSRHNSSNQDSVSHGSKKEKRDSLGTSDKMLNEIAVPSSISENSLGDTINDESSDHRGCNIS